MAGVLQLLSPEEKRISQALLNYPEDSVGRLMTPDFISAGARWTIGQVLEHIRRVGDDSETLNVIYVTDAQGRLIDDVRIRELLLRPLDTSVEEIHDAAFVALHPTDPEDEALKLFRKYDRNTLPGVDSLGKLLGIVTIDDVLDAHEDEVTGDIQKMAGTAALEEPCMDTPLLQLVRTRAPWLVVLFFCEMLTATAIGYYELELERAVLRRVGC